MAVVSYFSFILVLFISSNAAWIKLYGFGVFRAGGLVAFTVYMITTFSLYVPDWSFVATEDDRTERYTVTSRKHLVQHFTFTTTKKVNEFAH